MNKMTKHISNENTKTTLTNITEEMIQPNAIDLKLDRVWMMHGIFSIDEEKKSHRNKIEVEPETDGYFYLKQGTYEVTFDHQVSVGMGEAGIVITRSTLNRNGVFITSGLYDSGYNGSMAGCLHVEGGMLKIKKGTRVAQYLIWDAESVSSYDGDYGVGKQMDAHLRN